jgi:hypothetical protein
LDVLEKTIENFEQNLAAYPKGVWAQHAGRQHVAIVPKTAVPPSKEPLSRPPSPLKAAAHGPKAARGKLDERLLKFQPPHDTAGVLPATKDTAGGPPRRDKAAWAASRATLKAS